MKNIYSIILILTLTLNPYSAEALNNDFSFKIFQELSESSDENVFISPYSIYVALSLAYAGAKENTKSQFEQALGIYDPKSFHEEMSKNIESLNERDGKGFSLYVANALWVDKQTKILTSYTDTVKKFYNTSEHSFDKSEPQKAAKQVNNWVSEKTKDKIKELVTSENMQVSDLVLTNAIYFKGDWWSPFEKELTRESNFKLFSDNLVKVKMMNQTSHFNFKIIDGVKFIELAYKSSELSMILVLPEQEGKEALDLAEKNLAQNFKKFDSSDSKNPEVILSVPKFEIKPSLLILNKELKQLGLKDAFEFPIADFSGINGNKDLFIGLVAHKAMIKVDEAGTEAAAATAIEMLAGAAFNPNKPEEFKADRPFLYLIRDKKTGLVLFIGKIINPIS